ncbi:MAG: hypothetical protein PHF86_08290 [Candidatus Nanoarchaeia archaeon]|nr:hypothetical protein [Candidatus Nanoarchaeia archaeon]
MASCLQCRGKLLCKRDFCPIYTKAQSMFKINQELKEIFDSNSPPSVFIESKLEYPEVNVGILSPTQRTEEAYTYDSPEYWYKNNLSIKQVVELRSSLINSRFKAKVNDVRKGTKFLDIAQEIAMIQKPVDIEINLKKKPTITPNFEKIIMPFGVNAPLKDVKITENVKINNKIDKVFGDYDLKAIDAIKYLYKNEFSENALSQLLSIGIFGLKKDRKLVSTRWSIVATIDIIGKNIIEQIKEYNSIDNYQLFTGNYFGNYYYILLIPNVWSYELFESYLPGALWNFSGKIETSTDYEDYYGRKNYAEHCVGGYYFPRLKILEYLNNIKKQASCLVIRFETPEYSAPLGVWVTGAGTKKALENLPLEFNSFKDAFNHVKSLILNKFNFNIDQIYKDSILIKKTISQTKLNKFF